MNRAFVKESDQDTETLPERAVSAHANFVTARGLALLEASVRELEAQRTAARSQDDRAALARVARDLRYFISRRDSARLIQPPAQPTVARFGVAVTVRLQDGQELRYRIVGEDEADPRASLISYVSPIAKTLIGATVGATVEIGGQPAQIVHLES
ncbi:MAG TPA: GreA/GreB family elongation factor [Steroidobacteraceae bacterium]